MEPYRNAQSLKDSFQAVMASAVAWHGTAYRAVGLRYANQRDLLSGEGTKRVGGRWTPLGSFATVHVSLDIKTALDESLGTQKSYGIAAAARLPLTLVAIDVQLESVIDLTDEKILAALGLTRQRLLRCRWRQNMDAGREALTQAVGRIAFEAGLEGLVVPSAQARKGQNLVIFPSNLQTSSSLTIQNVQELPEADD